MFSLAQYNIGLMYKNGIGVSIDYKIATEWLQMAANQGYASAKDVLQHLYSQAENNQSNSCFIATAVFIDPMSPEVVMLRAFRNNHLSQFFIGKIFIKSYYKIGPGAARLVKKSRILQNIIKTILKYIVKHLPQ